VCKSDYCCNTVDKINITKIDSVIVVWYRLPQDCAYVCAVYCVLIVVYNILTINNYCLSL